MAKGGSGDVLTGIITALCAQGIPPLHAAMLGTYLHGSAGDIAAAEIGMDGMIAGDIAARIPKAFQRLRSFAQSKPSTGPRP
jgi:NAD(P)H-hydrate epimerase